jgi:16S rRNA (adenine1518-N6/adenine1519-N6)-dimethyltransferase
VAERLAAAPGSSDYGALTVNVQVAATVKLIGKVSAGAFHPKPTVDSAIVLLTPHVEPLLGANEETAFRKFVQAAFGMRRKQMLRVLRELWIPSPEHASAILSEAGIDHATRPETIYSDALKACKKPEPRGTQGTQGRTRWKNCRYHNHD